MSIARGAPWLRRHCSTPSPGPAAESFVTIVRGDGRRRVRRRRHPLRRRARQPLVLQRRPRAHRDRRRRGRPDAARSRTTTCSTSSPTSRPRRCRRGDRGAVPDPRRPGVPHQLGVRGRRHRGEAGPRSLPALGRARPAAHRRPQRSATTAPTIGGTALQGLPLNREGWGRLLERRRASPPRRPRRGRAPCSPSGATRSPPWSPSRCIGAGGVHPPPTDYLAGLRALCDEHGALLIFDEVITGFGRLGAWFAADHYGVTPDLITFAKARHVGLPAARRRDRRAARARGARGRPRPTCCATATPTAATPRPAPPASPTWRCCATSACSSACPPSPTASAAGCAALRADGHVADVRGDGAIWAAAMHRRTSTRWPYAT